MTITRRTFGAGTAALLLAGPARAADGDVVRFGYTGPLSGGAALYGKNALSGLQMAAAELNAAGGIDVGGKKLKVEIVSLDDRYSPPDAAVNAKRLVQQSGAPAVFCPHSGGILAIEAFNQDENFLLAAYTSSPAVTERGDKLVLRIPPSFATYVTPFVTYEMKRFGKKLGMAGGDHEYAKAWSALFGPAWTKAGGTVVADNPMSYNKDADYYSGISKVLSAGPDVLFVGGASEPTGLVIRQAREQGFQGGFAIMDQAKMDEIARVTDGYDMLDGAIGVLPLANDDRPSAKDFVARYRAMFKAEAGTEAVLNFTGLNVIAKAMQLANSATDAKAIRAQAEAAVKALPPKENPVVITGVDAQGGFLETAPICAVEKGKVVALDATTLGG